MAEKEPKVKKEKKPRTKVILPAEIENGDEMLLLANATLAILGEAQRVRKDWLANFDEEAVTKTKIELRAINAEIRNRAKN